MNIVKNQPDALNYQVTIEIAAADYAEALHKRLNEYKRKADIKGFRKGMAPLSLIQRLYGDQALYDSVNSLVGESLDKFIQEEKVRVVSVYGANNPKEGELDDEDKSTGGSYSPGNGRLPHSGTYYMITTTIPGHITAFITLNANKNFYVVKKSNAECLPISALTLKGDGAEPVDVTLSEEYTIAEKMTGTVEFDVEAKETYYVFCTGSKLTFGGYEVVSGSGDEPEVVLGDANGDGQISIVDASMIVEYVLSGNTSSMNFKNADINGDGDVNITDASIIVGIILNN